MWKKGNGELDPSTGVLVGSLSTTFLTVHSPSTLIMGVKPRSRWQPEVSITGQQKNKSKTLQQRTGGVGGPPICGGLLGV